MRPSGERLRPCSTKKLCRSRAAPRCGPWTLYDPTLLVSHVLSSCPALAEIYRAKLAEKPDPWHIVIGYDEHVPVDKLKAKHLRKSMVASFNFLELGEELLARDCTWFVPVVLRSS